MFLVASIASFIALRYWVADKSQKYHPHQQTNMYALKGQRAQVTKRITRNEPGEIKIKGDVWMARTQELDGIEVGEWVRIITVTGSSVVVVREKETN